MNGAYVQMAIAALLPVAMAGILYLLDKRTAFGRLNRRIKQAIYGILFGGLAILSTEWGIPISGAQVNCRDAAVLTAGLMFGAPAGIIAGLIGGVERWIAVAWGVGTFTRTACSISTIIAGFYAAFLRIFLFEDKKSGWAISFASGIVMEIFHMTMIFITNMATPEEAMQVVKLTTVPMVAVNSLSVLMSSLLLSFLSREKIRFARGNIRISQTIQRWLLITVVLAFAATSYFVFSLQDEIATVQADRMLEQALEEVSADIRDASDENLLTLTKKVEQESWFYELDELIQRHDLAEISIVDDTGTIVDSTTLDFMGYDMASGEQSAEFLCLLDGKTTEFVQEYGPISYDHSVMRKYAAVSRFGGGFLQVGYDAKQFQEDIDKEVLGITRNRHVGQTGYILILDENYRLVSSPEEITQAMIEKAVNDQPNTPAQNLTFRLDINGEHCYSRYRIREGYYIVSVLPEAEALQMRNIALYVNTFMEILVFGALFVLIYLLIKRVVVNQITNINGSLARITGGDLDEVVNVRTNQEFASLSDDINRTVDTLKRYIAEASARIDQELEFAKNIQASALPNVFPAFPKRKDFDIYALMDPAKEVGGDFYDFYFTHDDTLNFLVADVSGKGIPAAMFMMRAKTQLKSLTEADMPLNEVFTRGNAALCEGNDAGMFVTAWQGSLDLKNGQVLFANAGHNPPLIRHGDGSFEYLRTRPGFVLAGMDEVRYRTQELQLQPGDVIYLYTDGVPEATNVNNELYGEDRLLAAVNAGAYNTMEELCRAVKMDVDAFVGDAPQFDDITMVALHYIGTPPAPSIRKEEARLEDIPEVTEFVESVLEEMGCGMKTVIQINVAIDEIFSNIVRYGYPQDRPGPVLVEIISRPEQNAVSIRFTDEGIPYNPLTKEDPDVTLSAEERKIGGLGIYMVKKTMDDMKYEYENDKNILTLTKKI